MKNVAISLVVGVLLGAGVGTFLFPQIKEKQVEVEKVVKDVVTVTKIVTRPDGSKEEVTTTTDRTKENKSNTMTKKAANWHVSISAQSKVWPVQVDAYTLQAEKRIIGDLFVGAIITSDKRVGLSLGLEF
jgi:hypothetical protein